ncbi:DNA primase [Massilia sp. P8910]|uniref:DNA primase n=1 Tax=Massilia antarctica TaxID=2765360 RepID=UPI0006BB83AC|nr:DNA primase [Massilia antarctica]MCY0911020.1 DNA primase [Massilia sp. H27-R4]CUI05405.1 DNA primase [Janthinobacterium sp. CG23_2]CUU29191.1 DNA primase [Janthinobacterium sp. CG23_2]
MIPQSFLTDLLNRIDIVDVVGRYVQLKKGGANFMGLCPFHSEKSPSFTVSPTKQFYHCFGCSAHGNAVGFLIEYSGMGFIDAVKDLAQGVGMVVPDADDKIPPLQRAANQAQALALTEAMTQACDYYRGQLRGATNAIAYLKNRGLTGEVAARFGMGYAPSGWDNLRTVFPDYEALALVESGLVIDKVDEDGGNKKRYDRFRERIMFPIRNTKGQVIGFGGRVLDQGEPKYLNSPETPLFQKGLELYGLFEARQAIRDAGYVLVTEGYMDVVALAQLGFPQAVATLGTACTSTHVQKLLRQTDSVIFSFDGDKAGRRAARRALEACLPQVSDNKIIKFLFLPAEHDPDSFVREFGADVFEQEIHEAMPLSQFLLREVSGEHDLSTPEGRARVQFDAKPLLQSMTPSSLRLQIVRGLASMTESTPAEIEALFELSKPVSVARRAPPRQGRPEPVGLELQILRHLVAHPPLSLELDEAALAAFSHFGPESAERLLYLVACGQALGANGSFAALSQHLKDTSNEYDGLIAEIASEPESDFDSVKLWLIGAVRQIKLAALKQELTQLFSAGLTSDQVGVRYREIMAEQKRLEDDGVPS